MEWIGVAVEASVAARAVATLAALATHGALFFKEFLVGLEFVFVAEDGFHGLVALFGSGGHFIACSLAVLHGGGHSLAEGFEGNRQRVLLEGPSPCIWRTPPGWPCWGVGRAVPISRGGTA